MQQVVKVSIGNIAFTLEKEAYELTQDYLSQLENYYSGSQNCGEILSEIEFRIAELLSDRGYRTKIVPTAVVNEVIRILGRPEDFESGGTEQKHGAVRKRLYRDTENKIVGGVCSGLGAYFAVDPILFRVVFAAWSLAFLCVAVFEEDWGWGLSMSGMLAYVILWISMPEARTVEQRYSMKGGSVSLENIHTTVSGNGEKSRRSKGFRNILGRCASIFTGALLMLMGTAGCISAIILICGIGVLGNGLHAFGIPWLMSVVTDTAAWVSVLAAILGSLAVLLPFIGMLYAGTLLLFKLKSPKWKPGLIIFIIWVVSLLGFIGVSAGSLSTIRSTDCSIHESRLPVRDTLFIEFAGCSQWKDFDVLVDADRNSYDLLYMGKNGSDPCLVIYPDLYVGASMDSVSKVVSYAEYVTDGMNLNDLTGKKSSRFWSFDADSRTLRIEPVIFSSDIRTTDIERQMRILLSKGTCVIVREPVWHEFNSSFEYCSSRFLKIVEELR
ncbi:MAG TPA: PspC domain-containing protein [Candidatus Coprenecus stercoravium]|uniref:PspC domain-containing protein n=1 Tax=Candidatus Coprenecus stercoravium TaxID=2840735 RepID=A0A9D2GPR4_9BACT|nr:PspC domain-containing protein [Candidatus Coprenecus stercoravium]